MRPSWSSRAFPIVFTTFLALSSLTSAINLIESKSLNPCQDNSSFTATLFNVIFTPDNNTIAFDVVGVSSISGNVTAELEFIAYGYVAVRQKLDPCTMNLQGLCPMNTGQINIQSNIAIPEDVKSRIPSIAYGVPDLDGLVRIYINNTAGVSVACVEAQLSNGKTVDQKAVGWTTAVIAGLALLAAAVTSGLGHSNTAAHVAANSLSLFGFFQAQAMIGMTSVTLPPIVQSWTQNFQWSMGIIRIGFVQDVCTWYQRSTGGNPSTLLSTLATTSVEVEKRSLDTVHRLFLRAYDQMNKRSNNDSTLTETTKLIIVRGIQRVGFRAGIEITNIFMTGLIFFMIFLVFVVVVVAAFKAVCELLVRAGRLKGDKFQDFRNGWRIVLKGILFRVVLIGYPQICVLSSWELTRRDSAAEVVLAIFFFISMSISLAWAALKVIRLAKRSVNMHKNPAYILYSDPAALNKWGFLYVQFRATAYYFILPVFAYIVVKSAFIGLSQKSQDVQAVALVIIEAVFLISVSILRPWMDKKTNAFNITIAAINFLNVIFLLIFTTIFNQPDIVTGVMGVIFFVYNAVFALVLLLMVLISSIYAITSKNPETRYQPMRDDRGSFIKSQPQLTTELDALGVTARGDMKSPYRRDLDDDDASFSSGSLSKQQQDAHGHPLPPSTANSARPSHYGNPPLSPVDPSIPLFPSDGSPRYTPQSRYADNPRPMYSGYNDSSRPGSDLPLLNARSNNTSPQPRNLNQYDGYGRTGSNPAGFRQQNNVSPWQRGAGYDH
ncbi:TRP-like family [Lasallia pustulata]|uniref:TRP-like family n=1 Tax=Lasallia pustulata TaxID=136370 RepID=A0A1W5D084_9LECA|nr:TRP-like family [Lasallia pustulata]